MRRVIAEDLGKIWWFRRVTIEGQLFCVLKTEWVKIFGQIQPLGLVPNDEVAIRYFYDFVTQVEGYLFDPENASLIKS